MSTIVTIILILLVIGAFGSAPFWPHAANLGWGPSGGLWLIFIVLLVLVASGKLG